MPVVVHLKNKESEKMEKKTFNKMEDFEDWVESSEAEKYEVEKVMKVMNEEVKASGEDSSVMGTHSTNAEKNKRRADKKDQKEPMQKSRQSPNVEEMPVDGKPVSGNFGIPSGKTSMMKEMISTMTKMTDEDLQELYKNIVKESNGSVSVAELVKDDFVNIFEGDETFSEDFKRKAFVIFESAIVTKLEEEKEALREEYEERFQEEIANYENKLNDYAKYVVNEWVEENEDSLEESIKSELFDSLINSMRDVFLEHNISFDETSVDVVENLNNKIESLKEELNYLANENIKLENSIFENECKEIFSESVKELTETQKEKIAKIADSMAYNSVEDFKAKLDVIKESYFEKSSTSKNEQYLNEEYDGETSVTKEFEPHINAAREAIKRSVRSN